jgi:hypothetical protein
MITQTLPQYTPQPFTLWTTNIRSRCRWAISGFADLYDEGFVRILLLSALHNNVFCYEVVAFHAKPTPYNPESSMMTSFSTPVYYVK